MKTRDYLKSLPPDQRELGARVLDIARLALKRAQPVFTDFLDPGQQVFCKNILMGNAGLAFRFLGGYSEAERKRMAVFPDDTDEVNVEDCICFLSVTGNFRFQKVSHRDFLGGILGTGVKREKLGDILLIGSGCQVVAAREIKDYMIHNLTKIHQVPVVVNEISRDLLEEPARNVKEISTTVSSLRLDAVAGAGCGMSRSRIAKYINGEKVKVNWEVRNNPDYPVKEGDVISVRGFGRMKVEQVKGETKKGRTGIKILRYL